MKPNCYQPQAGALALEKTIEKQNQGLGSCCEEYNQLILNPSSISLISE
jgi:hypothetical protein